tara:strand:- start:140 stop:640 length:501 start_codon:yes stop_codon:yes gene_type:complete
MEEKKRVRLYPVNKDDKSGAPLHIHIVNHTHRNILIKEVLIKVQDDNSNLELYGEIFEMLLSFWNICGDEKQKFFVTFDFSKHVPLNVLLIQESAKFFMNVKKITQKMCFCTLILCDSPIVTSILNMVRMFYVPSRPMHVECCETCAVDYVTSNYDVTEELSLGTF